MKNEKETEVSPLKIIKKRVSRSDGSILFSFKKKKKREKKFDNVELVRVLETLSYLKIGLSVYKRNPYTWENIIYNPTNSL